MSLSVANLPQLHPEDSVSQALRSDEPKPMGLLLFVFVAVVVVDCSIGISNLLLLPLKLLNQLGM